MKLTEEQKRFNDILNAWHTPMTFHPGGWEESLPEWMNLRVIRERLAMLDNGGWDKATNAEITAYLYTASLVAPMSHEWANIMVHVTGTELPLPEDFRKPELTDYELTLLNQLKHKMRDRQ